MNEMAWSATLSRFGLKIVLVWSKNSVGVV